MLDDVGFWTNPSRPPRRRWRWQDLHCATISYKNLLWQVQANRRGFAQSRIWFGFGVAEGESWRNRKIEQKKNIFCSTIQVDILDTSGDLQFPAMRRLSIATAHAFLLVYSVTSAPSFTAVKQCYEEIKEQRADFQVQKNWTQHDLYWELIKFHWIALQEIPIVICGNKSDLVETHREVRIEDVSEWVYCELPKLR